MCSEKTIPPLYIERTTGSLRKVPITLAREKDYSPLLYTINSSETDSVKSPSVSPIM
jgi:hypothetical protein